MRKQSASRRKVVSRVTSPVCTASAQRARFARISAPCAVMCWSELSNGAIGSGNCRVVSSSRIQPARARRSRPTSAAPGRISPTNCTLYSALITVPSSPASQEGRGDRASTKATPAARTAGPTSRKACGAHCAASRLKGRVSPASTKSTNSTVSPRCSGWGRRAALGEAITLAPDPREPSGRSDGALCGRSSPRARPPCAVRPVAAAAPA